jgi:hypothetical protein
LINKLESRYGTYFPELHISLFLHTERAIYIETMMKHVYYDQRSLNINGNKTEWFVMPLIDIISSITYLLNNNIHINEPLKICNRIHKEYTQYVDYIYNKSYEEINKISMDEMYEIIDFFKEEKSDDTTVYEFDKWFFHDIVVEGLDENIYKQLYSLWIQNRVPFYNLWFENNNKKHPFRKYYGCLNHCTYDKLNVMHYLNSLLGINNSSFSVTITIEQQQYIYQNMIPHLNKIRDTFKVRSDSNNNYDDIVVINHLNYIYKEWCGTIFIRKRKQKNVKGMIYDKSSHTKEHSNIYQFIKLEVVDELVISLH